MKLREKSKTSKPMMRSVMMKFVSWNFTNYYFEILQIIIMITTTVIVIVLEAAKKLESDLIEVVPVYPDNIENCNY